MKSSQKVLVVSVILLILIEAVVLTVFLGGKTTLNEWSSFVIPEESGPTGEWNEVKVGDYEVRNSTFGNSTMNVELSVYARVAGPKYKGFAEALDQKRKRVDEAISSVVRTADFVELQEPTLHSLRRRVTHAVKEVLGDQMAEDELILPDFRIYDL